MENNAILIEQILPASPDKVWRAITDKDEMKQWYFNLPTFNPEVGFEFQFTAGPENGIQYLHLCKVTEAITEKKLVYSWWYNDYEGESLVTFELFPSGNQTKLKLTHDGLESFPSGNPDFSNKSFTEGWTMIIGTSLKEFLEIRTNPE